jgi:diguanylate cyclase (GGDEF)-like protein
MAEVAPHATNSGSPRMIKPPLPPNEPQRLAALQRYRVLDTAREPAYDDLLLIARAICGTPMGAVSLIDSDRQWFTALQGLQGEQTPREESFCGHTIAEPSQLLMVEDARQDIRFHDNPSVVDHPYVRFYAGVPLLSSDGYALGTLCVFDSEPRLLAPDQGEAMWALARQVGRLLEMRLLAADVARFETERRSYEQRLDEYQQQLELANVELLELSRTDPLTGLANRRTLTAALGDVLAQPAGQAPVLIIVDVDHFKQVNDQLGHAEGDRVLVELAVLLQRQLPHDGVVARYGGEEFVILLSATSAEQARTYCEQLRLSVMQTSFGLPITVSIGLAVHRHGEAYGSLLQRADAALYQAKRAGRNCVIEAG